MFGGILSEVLILTALNDGEEGLAMTIERFGLVETLDTTVEPALGQSQGVLGILIVALARRTLIERHHDIGTDDTLGIHHVLRGEDMLGTVDMTTELASLLAQLSDTGQGEDLETTRVGQDRTVPCVELMQATGLTQGVETRAQVQVVGVAQDDLSLHLFTEFREMNTLHATTGTNGHEDWRLDLSVVSGDNAGAGTTVWVCMLQFECHLLLSLSFSSSISNFSGLSTISSESAKSHTSCTFST